MESPKKKIGNLPEISSDLFRFWSTQGLGWQGHTCVEDLPELPWRVCAKFGSNWSDGLQVTEEYRYNFGKKIHQFLDN